MSGRHFYAILPDGTSSFTGYRNPVNTVERDPEETIQLVRQALRREKKFPHARRLILADIMAIIDGRI